MNPWEDRIRRLEEELSAARRAIIGLMPEEVERLLVGYVQAETRDDFRRWEHDVIDKIIARAKPFNEVFQPRAYCPLCLGSSSAPYSEGFTYPEGLKRHLTGFGNTRQCDVTLAAFELAGNRRHELFDAVEREERVRESADVLLRKTRETLYLVAPDREPELIDRSMFSKPRDKDAMAWAEKRLEELNFQVKLEGKVKSYTLEREAFAVFADPREKGRIEFAVFKKPLLKRSRRPRFFPRFHLLDSWKNDIRGKFEKRLAEAVADAEKGRI